MRKLMEYHIISGRTVETRRTWLPSGPTVRKKRGIRRAGASSLKKIKANEKSCVMNLARSSNFLERLLKEKRIISPANQVGRGPRRPPRRPQRRQAPKYPRGLFPDQENRRKKAAQHAHTRTRGTRTRYAHTRKEDNNV